MPLSICDCLTVEHYPAVHCTAPCRCGPGGMSSTSTLPSRKGKEGRPPPSPHFPKYAHACGHGRREALPCSSIIRMSVSVVNTDPSTWSLTGQSIHGVTASHQDRSRPRVHSVRYDHSPFAHASSCREEGEEKGRERRKPWMAWY